MRLLSSGNELKLAAGLLLLLLGGTPAAACGWWCGEDPAGHRRAFRGYGYYGYQAFVPARRPVRLPSRAYLANTPPVPGGPTTLDPPGLMTTQGILESPVPSPGRNIVRRGRPCVWLQQPWMGCLTTEASAPLVTTSPCLATRRQGADAPWPGDTSQRVASQMSLVRRCQLPGSS